MIYDNNGRRIIHKLLLLGGLELDKLIKHHTFFQVIDVNIHGGMIKLGWKEYPKETIF